MDQANTLYNRSEYEQAFEVALKVLEDDPENIRMLRVAVSSSCAMGETATATQYIDKLPERHRESMRRRCKKFGTEL